MQPLLFAAFVLSVASMHLMLLFFVSFSNYLLYANLTTFVYANLTTSVYTNLTNFVYANLTTSVYAKLTTFV